MKIAFFTDTFLPETNGVVTAIINYAKGLTAQGHEVLIVAPKYRQSNLKEIDQKVIELLGRKLRIERLPAINGRLGQQFQLGLPHPRLYNLVQKFDADIFHAHTPLTISLQALLLSKNLKVPLVATHHTHYTDREALKAIHTNLYHSALAVEAQKGIEVIFKGYLNQHDLIIAPTSDVANYLKKMKVNKPIKLIPSPIDIENLRSGKKAGQTMRKNLSIEQSLVFTGRLSGEKNINLILESFALARQKLPKLRLVLIGDGQEREKLFSFATELGVNQAITWTGEVPHHTLIKEGYYYLGDVFITLSRFETQGLSTLEAIACGLPVIGADAHATTEVVHDCGIVTKSQDPAVIAQHIIEMFSNKNLRAKYQHACQKNIEKYGIELNTNKMLAVYKDLLRTYS